MKILVIGLGSMGKRRIRLLKQIINNVDIIGFDNDIARMSEVSSTIGIRTTLDYKLCSELEHIDACFVCVSPPNHFEIIRYFITKGINVFSEINIINEKYNELMGLIKSASSKVFLSSTMKYRHELIEISKIIKTNAKPLNYHYHVGQYLPDWHPWEDFSSFFVGNKNTNAIREILAIELPWIIDSIGKIKHFSILKNNISTLKIDYPDVLNIILTHDNGNTGSFVIDLVSRPPIRELNIVSEGMTITWKGTPSSLNIHTKDDLIMPFIDKNFASKEKSTFNTDQPYIEEILEFLDYINNTNITPKHDYIKDMETINIINEIEYDF
jgi:predicted dehydrogenase